MKFKSFMTMAMGAVALVLGVCSCSSDDDDEPEVPVAAQVVGTYTGDEVITIMGEPEDDTATFQFTKASDTSIDMIIPQSGDGGMVIPPLTVKNIPVAKVKESIVGKLTTFAGTVTNSAGAEKAFTVSDLMVVFEDVPKGKAVVVTYVLKYGNMPFDMVTAFNGDRQ